MPRTKSRNRSAVAGGRKADLIYEADPDGRPVVHERIVDPLETLRRRGAITEAMWLAGRHLQQDFHIAQLDRMPLSRLIRLPGGGADGLGDAQIDARRRLFRALVVLGGPYAPPAACVWHVVCEEGTLTDFAKRRTGEGAPLNRHLACGMLIASLAILAAWYGYESA